MQSWKPVLCLFCSMGECPISIVTALMDPGSGDISEGNHDRTSVINTNNGVAEREMNRKEKKKREKKRRDRRRKHGLTLLMEYVVVEERALPVGAPSCATILESRAPAPAPPPGPAPMLPRDSNISVWPIRSGMRILSIEDLEIEKI